MTKEELEKASENFIIDRYKLNECYIEDNAETREYMRMDVHSQYEEEYQLYLAGAEPREKRIAELEKKISILLSCKNCPDNKGGLLCQKEYEDKCLAQKIQYIKELEERNAELEKKIENLQKYLDTRNCYRECAETWEKLTKAKDLIRNLLRVTYGEGWNYSLDVKVKAEQFLKECE